MIGTDLNVFATIFEHKNSAQLQNKKHYVQTLTTLVMVAS
jgi:hypothetical protein